MIDPESLSSLEVLQHLRGLGYRNISSLQLREFMHDLKKLIKYEQKCRKGFEGVINSVEGHGTSVPSSPSQKNGNECNLEEDSGSTNSSELCTNCNVIKTNYNSDVISNVSSSSGSDSKKKKFQFTQQINIRPQPSFIRPWRLQPSCKGPIPGSLKSDPVQLYHKYREMWAQQKVPGEKSHSQLRWTIREKMLGQDPHPRPISEASSEYRGRSMSCK